MNISGLTKIIQTLVPWGHVTGKPATFPPGAHAASHYTGADQIANATGAVHGLMSAADKTRLDAIIDNVNPPLPDGTAAAGNSTTKVAAQNHIHAAATVTSAGVTTTITPTSTQNLVMRVVGTGGAVTGVKFNPAACHNGQEFIVLGTSDTNTVSFSHGAAFDPVGGGGTTKLLDGAAFASVLGAAVPHLTLGAGDWSRFRWDGTDLIEIERHIAKPINVRAQRETSDQTGLINIYPAQLQNDSTGGAHDDNSHYTVEPLVTVPTLMCVAASGVPGVLIQVSPAGGVAHGLTDGQIVSFAAVSGPLPTGIVTGAGYVVRDSGGPTGTTFSIALGHSATVAPGIGAAISLTRTNDTDTMTATHLQQYKVTATRPSCVQYAANINMTSAGAAGQKGYEVSINRSAVFYQQIITQGYAGGVTGVITLPYVRNLYLNAGDSVVMFGNAGSDTSTVGNFRNQTSTYGGKQGQLEVRQLV